MTSTIQATPTCAPERSPTPRGFPYGCSATPETETHSYEASRRGRETSKPSPKHPGAGTSSGSTGEIGRSTLIERVALHEVVYWLFVTPQ